jgi:Ran GTPase-activating protein (RanGAP) involved in mRNA processing and transport
MAAIAASEIKERYQKLCEQKSALPHFYVLKTLTNAAADFLAGTTDDLNLDLAGNIKTLSEVNVRLEDNDVDLLCTILSRSTALTSLDLRYNNLTDKAAPALARLIKDSISLREIVLMCNNITDEGASHIAKALHDSKTLRSLKLNGNKIGNRGGMYFAQALQINGKLRELDLGDCDLGTESVIGMATVLSQNKQLRAMNLNRPLFFSMQEECAVHLGRTLKVNAVLRELHLEKFDLKDFGVERLCDGLKENYTLVYLNLRCNRITRDGALTLSTLLRRNTPLEILDLGFNRIELDGAMYLSSALSSSNTNLKALVVVSNCIAGDGIVSLAAMMNVNTSLSNIYIWGNTLDHNACESFGQLIQTGRLSGKNTDVRPYEVDGRTYLSELSHGLRRFYYWTPTYGPDVVGYDE